MIAIGFERTDATFRPGDRIRGKVQWSELPPTSQRIEIRLIWYTLGKGTQDVEIVEKVEVKTPGDRGQQSFDFNAPGRPYSFSGTLISLIWAIEVIAFPQREAEQGSLIISPSDKEIILIPLKSDKKDKFIFQLKKH